MQQDVLGDIFHLNEVEIQKYKCCCPALILLSCLPLWKTERLGHNLSQNATSSTVTS